MKKETTPIGDVAQATVCADLTDEFSAPLARVTVDRSTTIADLAAQAELLGLPGKDYALYAAIPQSDGSEKLERLPQGSTLGDLDVPEDGILRLRYSPSLKGATT